jgi:hypothetical protein
MTKKLKIFLSTIVIWFYVIASSATIPAGYYYQAQNKKKAELKTALSQFGKPIRVLEYGSGPGFTWEGFYKTDRNADNSVWDMYSDSVRYFNLYYAVSGMHIEHSFPKSWWGGHVNFAYKDLFHLYPADGITNSAKNNLPLGEVAGIPWFNNGKSRIGKNSLGLQYTGDCFEPADEYKGDFARSYFYISTIYQDLAPLFNSPMLDNNTYPVWKPWALDLLMKWHLQDSVSEKELNRNEAVYKIQGNRNPFIDYPALANYIWGKDTASVFPFPAETEAFLVTPRPGNRLDMGVTLTNNTISRSMRLRGYNINSNIEVSLKAGHSSLQILTPQIDASSIIAGTDIIISFSPTQGGLVRDTLIIAGGGTKEQILIPLKALASPDFIILEPTEITPVGGKLEWIADPFATQYKLNLYEGDEVAGDLIISAYVEGTSWNKALEIYNGTGKPVDLSKYSIQRQSNGAGSFGFTVPLTGILNDKQTYVIVAKSSTNSDLKAKAQLESDSIVSFNGNDAVALVRNGIQIDVVGKANAGPEVYWGENLSLARKATVTHPTTKYNENEWAVFPVDNFSMLGSHTMHLTSEKKYVLQNYFNGTENALVVNNLTPETTYTLSVESMRSGVIVPSVNTMQIRTSALETPIIMEPTNITHKSFTANWEQTPYASGYLLNVFELTGQAYTTEYEGFQNIGSNGKPLPEGWTGTASGNYTTTTSAGIAPPSVQLKNNEEWLQTKTFPHSVTRFTFMYKWPSSGTGSSLAVYAKENENWTRIDSILYVNLSKYNPVYNFAKERNITTFRFIYYKAAGNMSIDDVSVTYNNQDTIYVLRNQPVESLEYSVENLEANTVYYYNVRATLNTATSKVSETAAAKTIIDTKVFQKSVLPLKYFIADNSITIKGLNGNEQISIFNTSGICIYNSKVSVNEVRIPFGYKGVFILNIHSAENKFTTKIITL